MPFRGPIWQNVRFWHKNGHFDPFQSLTLGGKKILTFQAWLKKSLVSPTWGQGAKLAWKMPFRVVNIAKCAILA